MAASTARTPALAPKISPFHRKSRQADRTNRALFGLIGSCLEAQIPPGPLTTVLLYYWCRTSTINANVPEPFFQTLERHWEVVVERVDGWLQQRAGRPPRP